MKNYLFYLMFISLSACGNLNQTIQPTISGEANYVFTEEAIHAHISYLASDELTGRDTGTEGINKAATYLSDEFKSYGLKPFFSSYRDSFKIESKYGYNVVGFLEGTDEKLKDDIFIIGAHYDHIGFSGRGKSAKDSIANGANDNASGVATVLELAKYFATFTLSNAADRNVILHLLFIGGGERPIFCLPKFNHSLKKGRKLKTQQLMNIKVKM